MSTFSLSYTFVISDYISIYARKELYNYPLQILKNIITLS